jgi:stalled ribosome rescue protein Dom34
MNSTCKLGLVSLSMRIINQDFKNGLVRLGLTSPDDSYFCSRLISPTDVVRGRSERKIKLGSSEEKSSVIKKTVTVEIQVEKVELSGATVRILGVTTQEHEDIPKGSHQNITAQTGDDITLIKKNWSALDKNRLTQATEETGTKTLAVVFDREEAYLALLTRRGFEMFLHDKGDPEHKQYTRNGTSYFPHLSNIIGQATRDRQIERVILASPAFWKEYLLKELEPAVRSICILASVSSVDETSFQELQQKSEISEALAKNTALLDEKRLEDALCSLRADMGVYGLAELNKAIDNGNLARILVSEELLDPQKSSFDHKTEIEALLERAESIGSAIHILTSERTWHKLGALGGILGVLRWKITGA